MTVPLAAVVVWNIAYISWWLDDSPSRSWEWLVPANEAVLLIWGSALGVWLAVAITAAIIWLFSHAKSQRTRRPWLLKAAPELVQHPPRWREHLVFVGSLHTPIVLYRMML